MQEDFEEVEAVLCRAYGQLSVNAWVQCGEDLEQENVSFFRLLEWLWILGVPG